MICETSDADTHDLGDIGSTTTWGTVTLYPGEKFTITYSFPSHTVSSVSVDWLKFASQGTIVGTAPVTEGRYPVEIQIESPAAMYSGPVYLTVVVSNNPTVEPGISPGFTPPTNTRYKIEPGEEFVLSAKPVSAGTISGATVIIYETIESWPDWMTGDEHSVSGSPTEAGIYEIVVRAHMCGRPVGTQHTDYSVYIIVEEELPTKTMYLKFDLGGGSGSGFPTMSKTGTSSVRFAVPSYEPVRDGYLFSGWTTSAGSDEVEYSAGDAVIVQYDSSTTLYAIWVHKLVFSSQPCFDGVYAYAL